MRQRKAKDLDNRLAQCGHIIISEEELKDCDFICKGQGSLFVEIGCGKGQFIIKKAIDNPGNRYLGIEGQGTVVLRAAEKAEKAELEMPIANLRFANCFVNGMDKLFEGELIDTVYLNFSDPWPKDRHAKRRLSYHKRLEDYARYIKPGGYIEIKTDNDKLFEFTLEEIGMVPLLEIVEVTRNLHGDDSRYESRLTMTEYEEKFKDLGKNINYVKVRVNK